MKTLIVFFLITGMYIVPKIPKQIKETVQEFAPEEIVKIDPSVKKQVSGSEKNSAKE